MKVIQSLGVPPYGKNVDIPTTETLYVVLGNSSANIICVVLVVYIILGTEGWILTK